MLVWSMIIRLSLFMDMPLQKKKMILQFWDRQNVVLRFRNRAGWPSRPTWRRFCCIFYDSTVEHKNKYKDRENEREREVMKHDTNVAVATINECIKNIKTWQKFMQSQYSINRTGFSYFLKSVAGKN